MLRLGIMLPVVMLTLGGANAKAESEPAGWGDESEEAESAEPARPASPSSRSKASAKASSSRRSRTSKSRSRSRGAKVSGYVVPDEKLRKDAPPRPSGNLHVFSLASHEEAKVNIYNDDGSYNIDAVKAVSHLLRCKRTETEKDIEPRLLVVLSQVYDHFGEKRIEIVSGFRNQRRTSSYHYKGSATDIRIPGKSPREVQAFVHSLDAGGMGIGLYPRSQFVHVDVRPPPSYRWIDWSKSDPNSPDKRPPAKLRKKRLQS
jgi:uncharacterized protein YcbK (DUF882 family)